MKKIALLTVLAATFAGGVALAPQAAFAANAKHPYKHVNHANDKGNRTGDAETERLNQAQLNQSGGGSAAPAGTTAPAPIGRAAMPTGTSTK